MEDGRCWDRRLSLGFISNRSLSTERFSIRKKFKTMAVKITIRIHWDIYMHLRYIHAIDSLPIGASFCTIVLDGAIVYAAIFNVLCRIWFCCRLCLSFPSSTWGFQSNNPNKTQIRHCGRGKKTVILLRQTRHDLQSREVTCWTLAVLCDD